MGNSTKFLDSDENEKNLEQFKERLFNEILSIYTRDSNEKMPDEFYFLDFPYPIKKMVYVLHTSFTLSKKLVKDDFQWYVNALEKSGEPISDIETHQIRMGAEFATWIVLLRQKVKEYYYPKLKNIINLWKELFIEKKSSPETGMFFLIELENLTNNLIMPLIKNWFNQIKFKPITKPFSILCALSMNTKIRLGDQIIEGAVRTIKKRAMDLEFEESIEDNPILMQAENYRTKLIEWSTDFLEQFQKIVDHDFEKPFYATILLVILIERFLLGDRKEKSRDKTEIVNNFIDTVITNEEVDEQTMISEFEKALLAFNTSDPIEFIEAIIFNISKDNNDVDTLERLIVGSIENETQKLIEKGEENKEIAKILAVQSNLKWALDQLNLYLKKEKVKADFIQSEKSQELIDNFMDGINRIKRIRKKEEKEMLIRKKVESLVNTAITKGFDPKGIIKEIAKNFGENDLRIEEINEKVEDILFNIIMESQFEESNENR